MPHVDVGGTCFENLFRILVPASESHGYRKSCFSSMWRYGSYAQVLQTIITNADTMEIYKKGDIMILPSGNLTELYKIDLLNRSV